MPNEGPYIVKSHDVHLDSEYLQWLSDLKDRYHKAQIKAAVRVNSEQLLFNWNLGRDLVVRKAEEHWGKGVVEQVSLDLQAEFPDVKGFSARNLWNMRKWYSFYALDPSFPERVKDIEDRFAPDSVRMQQLVPGSIDVEVKRKLQQAVAETGFPSVFAFVPWGHHVEIVNKCKTVDEALFYVAKTIEESCSRASLVNLIGADLFHSEGKALTNFSERLPLVQGKLARDIIKYNYDLGFISLPSDYDERSLELALEQNITRTEARSSWQITCNANKKGCTQDDSLAVQPFDPWAIRTPDPFLRREVLYPAELKDQRCIG